MSPLGRQLLLETPALDVWIGGAEADVATALAVTPRPRRRTATPPARTTSSLTSFRRSLTAGFTLQREAFGERNAVGAEDIGTFPEQNVADSFQSLPGISLSRDGLSNEGQRTSIRGLGAPYAVTTIDGAPVRPTSSHNVCTSMRDFNFDVFLRSLPPGGRLQNAAGEPQGSGIGSNVA